MILVSSANVSIVLKIYYMSDIATYRAHIVVFAQLYVKFALRICVRVALEDVGYVDIDICVIHVIVCMYTSYQILLRLELRTLYFDEWGAVYHFFMFCVDCRGRERCDSCLKLNN
jgi:hypothetical protein